MNIDSLCTLTLLFSKAPFLEQRRREGSMPNHLRSCVALGVCLAAVGSNQPRARADETAQGDASDGAPHMRLEDCVRIALAQSFDVLTAADEIAASESTRAGALGQLGPKLHVDASVQQWTEPYNIPFALTPSQPATNFPVHDAFVWNATVTLTQPLNPLYAMYQAYKVRDLGVDMAAMKREITRRDAAFRVIEGYYRLVQAERFTDVASASLGQLEAQLRQANSFHANGVVSEDDVLRAQLAVATAQERLIRARSRVTLGRSQLAVLLGMSPDRPIDAVALPPDAPPPAITTTLDVAERTAETQRTELALVDKQLEQYHREVGIARAKLAPQVSAVASYIHNEGSLFSQLNAGYVGAIASWDVWDWGTTTSGISEAKARLHQTVVARTKADDEIRLEVRQAFLDVGTATEAMAVARAAVAHAEEDFVLVKKRYDASAATSFDVIDAEGQLTQARGQLETARYDDLIARAALRRAMGVSPELLARE
jgi:outer membrane protein